MHRCGGRSMAMASKRSKKSSNTDRQGETTSPPSNKTPLTQALY